MELYIVRNPSGQFFAGGSEDPWTDEMKDARIYQRLGPARSQVSWWANRYPEMGIPDILKLNVDSYTVLDETARVIKQREAKNIKEAKQKERRDAFRLQTAQRNYEKAKAALEEAQCPNCSM